MHNIFKTDWYNRSKSTYTAGKSFIDWSSYSGGLCNFLYSKSDIYTYINDPVALANEMRSIIDVLQIKNVGVYIDTENGTSMTDGHNITVTSYFNPGIDDDFAKLDIELGLLFHEAAHCLFTNFNYMLKQSYKISKIAHWIQNVIEDEIIEEKLGRKNPGYDKFIAKTKYHYFDVCAKDEITKPRENDLDEWTRLFLYVIRYPKYISSLPEKVLNKYADMFVKISEIMTNFECGNYNYTNQMVMDSKCWMERDNTKDSINAALRIENLIKDMLPNYEKQMNQVITSEGSVINIIKNMDGDTSVSEATSSEVTKYRIEINNRIKNIKNKENNSNTDDIKGSEGRSTFSAKFSNTSVTPVPARYNMFVNEVKPLMKVAEKIIVHNVHKDINEELRFRRNGSLDPRRLAEAMMNINNVYQQQMTKRVEIQGGRYAFVIIMDESGSMQGMPRKIAQQLAVLFTEVLLKNPYIEIYVYGHGDYITKYLNKEITNKYNLGYVRIQGGQNDAASYTKILEEVKSQTNLPIVCLNITDGYYLSDSEPMEAFFNDYREKNVSFNLLNLGNHMSPRQKEINEKIYGGDVVQIETHNLEGMKEVIINLANIIQKNYKKYSK